MQERRNEHIEELVFDYLMGELAEDQKQELLAWLQADKENKKLFSEMTDRWAIAHVPLFSLNKKSDFKKNFDFLCVSDCILSKKQKVLNFWIRGAAVILLALTIGILSYYAGTQHKYVEDLQAFETVVPMGARSKIILPDRSIVWMNAGSSLKYTTAYGDKKREVWLSGEAYFEVEPDSSVPFYVNSEDIDVRVLGTSFNVKAYDDEEEVSVTLLSGKVDVRAVCSGDENVTQDAILFPDQMLRYNKKTHLMETIVVKASDACLWIDGHMKFKDLPFERIAKELERKYDVHITILSNVLKNEVFSGSFSADYSLSHILKEIDVEKKYKWFRKGNNIIIVDR